VHSGNWERISDNFVLINNLSKKIFKTIILKNKSREISDWKPNEEFSNFFLSHCAMISVHIQSRPLQPLLGLE
jgi:hypothetical protein